MDFLKKKNCNKNVIYTFLLPSKLKRILTVADLDKFFNTTQKGQAYGRRGVKLPWRKIFFECICAVGMWKMKSQLIFQVNTRLKKNIQVIKEKNENLHHRIVHFFILKNFSISNVKLSSINWFQIEKFFNLEFLKHFFKLEFSKKNIRSKFYK